MPRSNVDQRRNKLIQATLSIKTSEVRVASVITDYTNYIAETYSDKETLNAFFDELTTKMHDNNTITPLLTRFITLDTSHAEIVSILITLSLIHITLKSARDNLNNLIENI